MFVSRKDKESTKSIIRSWQNQAEGIKNALLGISYSPKEFTRREDIAKSVQGIAQSVIALDKAMTEERFYTDKEVKVKKEKAEEETKNLFKLR